MLKLFWHFFNCFMILCHFNWRLIIFLWTALIDFHWTWRFIYFWIFFNLLMLFFAISFVFVIRLFNKFSMAQWTFIHRLVSISFSSNFIIFFNSLNIPTLDAFKIKPRSNLWYPRQRFSLSYRFLFLVINKLSLTSFLMDLKASQPKLSTTNVTH